ncbi:hypothetical protein MMC26_001937 [Xylographa opegraphella]|nr:hypothetical protein [Xylographa opegraphella]
MEIGPSPNANGSIQSTISSIGGWAMNTELALEAILKGRGAKADPVKVIEHTRKQARHYKNGKTIPSFSMRDINLGTSVPVVSAVDLERQTSSEDSNAAASSRDRNLVSTSALANARRVSNEAANLDVKVTWDGPDDVANPKNWSYKMKWTVTIVISLYTLISNISTSIMAPALTNIGTDLNIHRPFQLYLTLSIFILAYAFGPFLIGPLSEIYGRVLVLQLSNLFYLISNTACGFAQSAGYLTAFRFLAGLCGGYLLDIPYVLSEGYKLIPCSAPYTIGGAILADCWAAEERGRSIGIYTLAPLLGPVIGPIIGGLITQHSTWRWVFWATSIASGIVQFLGFVYLRETYAPRILAKKARKLRLATQNQAWHSKWETSDRTLTNALKDALMRPFVLLGTQPIIQVLSLYIAYLFGLTYLPELYFSWHRVPDGMQSTARLNDAIYKRLKEKSESGLGQPEFRLPLMIPGGILLRLGLLWYGWSAQAHVHWIMPNIGIAIFGMGVKIGTQCTQTYAVDAYTLYAASASAAGTFLRSLFGFAFPLFSPYMYRSMGYGWGNSLLALIAVVLRIPAPLLLWSYGPWLRARSLYAVGDGE